MIKQFSTIKNVLDLEPKVLKLKGSSFVIRPYAYVPKGCYDDSPPPPPKWHVIVIWAESLCYKELRPRSWCMNNYGLESSFKTAL